MATGDTMGTPNGSLLESYRDVISATIAIQELHLSMARGVIEHSRKQQEAFLTLTSESLRAYADLLNVSLHHGEPPQARVELPVEDYERLSVGEASHRLAVLDAGEVEELKAYEKDNKNRPALKERFARSLV